MNKTMSVSLKDGKGFLVGSYYFGAIFGYNFIYFLVISLTT